MKKKINKVIETNEIKLSRKRKYIKYNHRINIKKNTESKWEVSMM